MAHTITVGVDIAKQAFHAVGLASHGKELWRKKLKRNKVLAYFRELEPCTVALEACGSAHHWGRQLRGLGHEVVLLPPQHVKAYQRGQKNDVNDARAIAEACQHNHIRPVPIKSVEQQDEQAFHRLRHWLTKSQTALINQVRGFLAENGIVLGKDKGRFRRELPFLLEDADNGLSDRLRGLLHCQYRRFCQLEEELDALHEELKINAAQNETLKRLQAVPGFGVINSSVFASWLGDGKQFQRGRDAAAALGLVPRQHTTGGHIVLLSITKRGDSYVRTQLIHGARAVVRLAGKRRDPLSQWINRLVATRGFNKAVVAYANKMARIGWVIVARGEAYRPPMSGETKAADRVAQIQAA